MNQRRFGRVCCWLSGPGEGKRIIRRNCGKNFIGPLDDIGWLADQPDDFRQWATSAGRLRAFEAGQYLFHAGDPPDGIYGLRSGSVELEFPLIGDEPVSFLRTTEGFWIGDGALLSKRNRDLSVLAVQHSTFVFLPGPAVLKLLEDEPKHWVSFHDLATRNAVLAVNLLSEALSLTVRGRVCRNLLKLSENRVEAHITQDALAKTLGIARPTLRRCLNGLADLGAIESKYRRVRILDRKVLETFKNEQ